MGFAFFGQAPFPFMSGGIRFRLAEFFILRSYRRSGVGRSAAHAALAAFPASLELTVLGRNKPALAFWRSALPQFTTAPIPEASFHGDVHFTFKTAAA